MIQIKNLSKSFGARVILDEISYTFPKNKIIGLVGVNGAGKTTFLNIISGIEEYDSGEINVLGSAVVGYLPQSFNENPKSKILEECMTGSDSLYQMKHTINDLLAQIEANYTPELYEVFENTEREYQQNGGYKLEANAEKILLGLGFTREQFENHPSTLSGGWRMRLELAKILVKNPDFLILDEPTNHLDLPSIVWLEDYLMNFNGTLLFISHDEELLNKLPDVILHLKDSTLNEYYGNYNDFLEQYEAVQSGKIAQVKNAEKKIEQLSKFVDKFGAKASKATQAKSKQKIIDKMQDNVSDIKIDKADASMSVRIPLTVKSGEDVMKIINGIIGYDKPLLKKFNFFVERGQKIAIVGANGLGKSTLLKTFIDKLPMLGGDKKIGHNVIIGYYAQDQMEYLDPEKTVIDNLFMASSTISDGEARRLLGSFLFKKDDVLKKVGVLSGGEKSRLSLACLLAQDANFLLLDEPTNHLDMESSRILARALKNYPGTVIFVSHNRKFISELATHTLMLSDKTTSYVTS